MRNDLAITATWACTNLLNMKIRIAEGAEWVVLSLHREERC